MQGEERPIDVLFTPHLAENEAAADRRHLGLLGRMAQGVAALEVFRNPCTPHEVRSCFVKLVELYTDLLRQARREKRPATTD